MARVAGYFFRDERSLIVMCMTAAMLTFLCAMAQAQSAFVRVNQVGYASSASKRAYLMSSSAETGATFVIQNSSGSTVFGPTPIGANLGSWSSRYPDVYALDFDSFVTAGAYMISVSGPIAVLHTPVGSGPSQPSAARRRAAPWHAPGPPVVTAPSSKSTRPPPVLRATAPPPLARLEEAM